MLFTVRELEIKPIRFDQTYAAGEIDFLEEGLTQVGPLSVNGVAELLEAVGEIQVKGEFCVRLSAECDRCLDGTELAIERKFDLNYQPAETLETGVEVGLKQGETEVGFFAGDGISLEEILREQVLLALPVQRLCREDCKGLCPSCGGSLNQGACACGPSAVKSGRMASALAGIRPKS